jgi:hypothetical protein
MSTEINTISTTNVVVEVSNLQGAVGPANVLTIGTVSTVPTGGDSTATITGVSPAQTLSFGIPRGKPAGIEYIFDTGVVDSDPGAGKIKFDNATIGSVTFVYIDNVDASAINQTAWYDTFDDSTSTVIKGQLIFNTFNLGSVVFDVTGAVTIASGYYKIPVTYVSGTIPTADTVLFANFYRVGDVGTLTQAQADGFYVNVTGDTMSGSLTMGNVIDMGSNRITNLATPIDAGDAVNKSYADAIVQGINIHASVRVATTANLTGTYNNGTAGVGATFTATANGAISIDGVSLSLNDRVLVKDQSTGLQNGIYTVTTVGTVSTPFVLTRATDADNSPAGEVITGDFCFTLEGTVNAGFGFTLTTTGTITIGTTTLTYTAFSSAPTIATGYGLLEPTPGTVEVDNTVIAPLDSPALTGTATAVNLNTSGTLTTSGILNADGTNNLAAYTTYYGGHILVNPWGRNTMRYEAIANSATVVTDGGVAWTASGTAAAVTIANTNLFTRTRRIQYPTGGTANTLAGIRNVVLENFPIQGIRSSVVVGNSLSAAQTRRVFIGFGGIAQQLTNAAYSSLTAYVNLFGFGYDTTHSNWQFVHNDSTGAPTVVDLGVDYPCNTINTDMFQFEIDVVPTGSTTYDLKYKATNLTTATTTGWVTVTGSDIPVYNLALAGPQVSIMNTTTTNHALHINSIYAEKGIG